MNELKPVSSFLFRVETEDDIRVAFQEVNGLNVSRDVEEIIEGGNNLYKHRLPTRKTYGNLTLKRAELMDDDPFCDWIKETLLKQESLDNTFGDQLKTLVIHLVSPVNEEEIKSWQIVDAYPIKWLVSNFNAMENKITIVTIELAFKYLHEID